MARKIKTDMGCDATTPGACQAKGGRTMKRANVTVSRNDVRPEGFKRWTVYAGGKAVFDIEATGLDDGKFAIHA